MIRTALALAALLCTAAAGCAQPPADPAPVWARTGTQGRPPADLVVWAADETLAALVMAASARIEAASGLRVAITADDIETLCGVADCTHMTPEI